MAFRRSALDPKLRSTGLMRRGCRTCLWVEGDIEGQPHQLPDDCLEEGLEATFLDREVVDEKAKTNVFTPLQELQKWREEVKQRLQTGEFESACERPASASYSLGKSQGRGADNEVVGGAAATFFQQNIRKSIVGGVDSVHEGIRKLKTSLGAESAMQSKRNISDNSEDEDKEEDCVDHRILHEEHTFAHDEVPLMICFPPPGHIWFVRL